MKGITLDNVEDQKLIMNALNTIGTKITSRLIIQIVWETKDKPKNTIELCLKDKEMYLLGKTKEIKKKRYKFAWYCNENIIVRRN